LEFTRVLYQPRPLRADLLHDALPSFETPGTSVDVRGPQPRAQQMIPAERSAPPSVVSRSPENSATTRREKCASNSNCDWLHSVIRKAAFLLALTMSRQRSYA